MVEDNKNKKAAERNPDPELKCKIKDKSFLEDFAPVRRDSDSSSSSMSPTVHTSKNENVFMRSGGGLQGLLWSKGAKEGKLKSISSPLAQRIEGRRSKSEPINDVQEAAKKYDYTPSSLRPRANSEAEALGEPAEPAVQEKSSKQSNSPKVAVDLKGIHNITRYDSFNASLTKDLMKNIQKATSQFEKHYVSESDKGKSVDTKGRK